MDKRVFTLGFLCCITLALTGWRPQSARDLNASFPLAQGTYWMYRGVVRSESADSPDGKSTQVLWKMSVIRTVERDGLLFGLVQGFPDDLNWSDGNAKPQLSVVIRTADQKFYVKFSPDSESIAKNLDDAHPAVRSLLNDDDWFLQLPLAEGQKFCDQESRKRDDDMYCWVVGAPYPAALQGVKGLPAGKRTAYQIFYRTNPDNTEIEFVEGVGITHYSYHHYGTIADTE